MEGADEETPRGPEAPCLHLVIAYREIFGSLGFRGDRNVSHHVGSPRHPFVPAAYYELSVMFRNVVSWPAADGMMLQRCNNKACEALKAFV